MPMKRNKTSRFLQAFLSCVIVLLSITSSCRGENHDRDLASLAEKWNITGPFFDYAALSFDLNYEVSDFILDAMVTQQVYDEGCYEGNTPVASNILAAVLSPDATPAGSGDFPRQIGVSVTVNPNTIVSSPIYSEEIISGEVVGTIKFCHRFMLSTLTEIPIEVNFRETLVTLTVDLSDGFSINTLNVEARDKLVRSANEAYEVEGYQCDFVNQPLTPAQLSLSRNQGSIIRICVTPSSEARTDGVYMRAIDSFVFSRDYGGAIGEVTQVAIQDGAAATNQLTELFCTSGDEVCVFESVLMAMFFQLPGSVQGSGVASMQFGSSNQSQSRRRLGTGDRQLQGRDPVAAVSEFDLSMELLPRTRRRSSAPATSNMLRLYIFITVLSICILL